VAAVKVWFHLGVVVAALVPGAAMAVDTPDRDPRNWPTVTRLIADRHQLAGRVHTLRVHARVIDYYNCSYRGTRDRLMAFSLLGGPFETLTGYLPRELGRILAALLEREPWLPITVQVRFDPDKMEDRCTAQVDILKWARGWQYPDGSLSPSRPDPTLQTKPEGLDRPEVAAVWRAVLASADQENASAEALLEPGAEVEIQAGAKLSAAYFCMFQGAERTHHALRLHDGKGRFVHAYLPRTAESKALIDHVALHRDVPLRVKAQVRRQAMSHYCTNQLEISSWTVGTVAETGGPSS
jgi:hypothetical protein